MLTEDIYTNPNAGQGLKFPIDPATVPGLPPGYKLVEATGMIEVWPGKPLVQLNGTVQELERQAKELNPDWKPRPFNVSTVDAQGKLRIFSDTTCP